MLDAVNAGRIADYRSPVTSCDAPAQGGCSGDERTISANAIHAIVNQAIPALRATEAGVRIAGARIAGELQLESVRIPYPLELIGCRIDRPINLNRAKLEFLNLAGSQIDGIRADSLELSSSLCLSNGFVTTGEVRLRRARIGGDLSCIGGRFDRPEHLALDAEVATIHGHVLLSNGVMISDIAKKIITIGLRPNWSARKPRPT